MEDTSSSITGNTGLSPYPMLLKQFGNGDTERKSVTARYVSRTPVTYLLLILLLLL